MGMAQFIIVLAIAMYILYRFRRKGQEIDRQNRAKATAKRKAIEERNRVRELEERVEELEDMLIDQSIDD